MKNYLFSLLILLAFASACKKAASPTSLPTNYRINNITAISLDANKGYHTILQYDLVATGPVQETVALSFEGLPNGVVMDTATVNTINTGIPGYSAIIHLMAIDTVAVAQGNYKVKLVCTGSVTGKKYYDVDLKVSAPKTHLLGAIRPCDLDTTVNDVYGNKIIFHPGQEVEFNGFDYHYNWNLRLAMDCDGNFRIPNYLSFITFYEGSKLGQITVLYATLSIEKDSWVINGDIEYNFFLDCHHESINITIPL